MDLNGVRLDLTRFETRVPPPVYAALAGVAQHLLARRLLARRLPGQRPSRPGRVRGAVAVGMAGGGIALGASALREFRTRRTTSHPWAPHEATTLVTTGANRISRNPMYLAMGLGLLAHAVALGRVRTVAPVVAFFGVIQVLQIGPEERELSKIFGADYERYCSSTPRWLGPRSLIKPHH